MALSTAGITAIAVGSAVAALAAGAGVAAAALHLSKENIDDVKKGVENLKKRGSKIRLDEQFVKLVSLGEGGFGRVSAYRKKKIVGKSEFVVAVKKVPVDNEIKKEALKKEAEKLSKLDHVNVVRYITYCSDPSANKVYLFMELAATSVGQMVKDASISESDARLLTRDIMDGMIYIHARDIIHCDIKGENVLLDYRGRAIICDFGISSYAASSSKESAVYFSGTVSYMSPELMDGKVHGKRSDVWALGCVVLEMLNQSPPFTSLPPIERIEKIKGLNHRAEVVRTISASEIKAFLLSIFVKLEERPYPESLREHDWLEVRSGKSGISQQLLSRIRRAAPTTSTS